ncbi:MAG: hypothetical protein LPH21_09685 [Shewanella sp.]|nr:hypothetical protein [Shewanella sp.]
MSRHFDDYNNSLDLSFAVIAITTTPQSGRLQAVTTDRAGEVIETQAQIKDVKKGGVLTTQMLEFANELVKSLYPLPAEAEAYKFVRIRLHISDTIPKVFTEAVMLPAVYNTFGAGSMIELEYKFNNPTISKAVIIHVPL